GMSHGPFASLNLGLLTDDDAATVHANRAETCEALGLDGAGILSGKQVHGAEVARREEPSERSAWLLGAGGDPDLVDGWATSAAELAPLVFVADCLPVALSGPGGVAMIHCGWRGLAAGIAERGVGEVEATAAAIGPGIGRCCFEVGEEVLGEFAHLGSDIADGRMLDLRLVCERLLRAAGVGEVEASGLCTSCESELFFSHRRDGGVTGRQAGVVWACPS
ncbi:MAG: polyphenol oxidase family protein, partial [Actinomycetota bacterium]|nr:polyphenol oxidase family protein [Actinomycetota bacterium]